MSERHDGRQIVGLDLHRHRTVMVRMTAEGERLEVARFPNDPVVLREQVAKARPAPEAVLEAIYGWYWAIDALGARRERRPRHLVRDGRLALSGAPGRLRAASAQVRQPRPGPGRHGRSRRRRREWLLAGGCGVRHRGGVFRRVRPRPGRQAGRQAGEPVLRPGGRGPHLRADRPAGRPGPWPHSPRRAGADHRRVRRGGQLRGAAGEVRRRRRQRRVQHRQGGRRSSAGRRPRHRLHPRGDHRRAPALRRHPRHRRKPATLPAAPALTPRGRLVIVGGENGGRWLGGTDRQIRARLLSLFVRQQLGTFINKENAPDLTTLRDIIDAGALTPAVDRTYPLDEVPAAIWHLLDAHARGKIVYRGAQRRRVVNRRPEADLAER